MYSRTHETKLVRTTHKIRFKVGHSVESLKQELANVPSHLYVTDIADDEQTGEIELHFLHEQEER